MLFQNQGRALGPAIDALSYKKLLQTEHQSELPQEVVGYVNLGGAKGLQ